MTGDPKYLILGSMNVGVNQRCHTPFTPYLVSCSFWVCYEMVVPFKKIAIYTIHAPWHPLNQNYMSFASICFAFAHHGYNHDESDAKL